MYSADKEYIYDKLDGSYDTTTIAEYIRKEIDRLYNECVIGLAPEDYDNLPEELQEDLYQKFLDRIVVQL